MKYNRKIIQNNPLIKIELARRNANLMSEFLSLGFKKMIALKELFGVYYPEVTALEVRRIWDVRVRDHEILDKFESLINKLKKE